MITGCHEATSFISRASSQDHANVVELLMKSTSARKACSAKTAYRGTLSRRQREDLRQAARLARTCGAGFILYGILVVPPGDAHRGRKIPERIDDEKKKMSVPDVRESESKETSDEARATTSKRQQKTRRGRPELEEEGGDEEERQVGQPVGHPTRNRVPRLVRAARDEQPV